VSPTIAVLCLLGAVALVGDVGSHPGFAALTRAWNVLGAAQQRAVCEAVRSSGIPAAARAIVGGHQGTATVEDAEAFLHTLACDVQVRVGSG
jgi:hypothetical protein